MFHVGSNKQKRPGSSTSGPASSAIAFENAFTSGFQSQLFCLSLSLFFFFAENVILVTLGAEKFVDSFWEAHGTIFGGFLQLLQGRCAPLCLQNGAFGVCGPRDGGVGQCLAQRAVPEQGVVENPVHPVSQRGDWGVLSVVCARDG